MAVKKADNFHSSVLRFSILAVVIWSIIIGGSLTWNVNKEKNQAYELALHAARAHFDKDQAFRLWGTKHGGVYVPPTEETPPNPYLAHLSNRDVVTTSGMKLTLMNPAYMVRQMMDDFSELYGITGRIVGLVALNPNNIADEWESAAIKAFIAGKTDEVIEKSNLNGIPHLRLIRPMIMTKGCVKCHGHLGFKVGDVRGGVGVSIPINTYEAIGEKSIQVMFVSHLAIYLLGLLGITAISYRTQQNLQDRKHASDQLQNLNQELQANVIELKRLEKLKDQFLANTSHELRTPLNGIIGIAESMISGSTGSITNEQKKNLNMVVSSGRRLFNLVNDLLDFSKLRNHDIELKTSIVDMNEIVQIVIQLSQPLIAKKPLKLYARFTADNPLIEGDEDRLQQILFNLVGNAIKFTSEGQIEVLVENIIALDSPALQITVSDTGIGIETDKLERIFESFEQAEGSISRQYGGTGLGLSISKKLAELHNGQLSVQSDVGKGTQFILQLPIARNAKKTNITPATMTVARLADENYIDNKDSHNETINTDIPIEATEALQGTILAVDDEPINLQVIHNQLTLHGYRILQASSGQEALKILEDKQPDLILLDLMMPLMSGFEVCSEVRKKYSLAQLPIIILTAKNQVNDLVSGFESGANDFLTKPFSQNELLYRIRTHLQLKKETDLKLQREATIKSLNENLEGKITARTKELEDSLEYLKKTQTQLIESEKMASLGCLVAGVAHEINTPIGVSVTAVSMLESSSKDIKKAFTSDKMTKENFEQYLEEAIELSEMILTNLMRAAQLIRSFKQVAVDQSSQEWRMIEVKKYLQEVLVSLHPKYKHLMEDIDVNCADNLSFTTNPGSLAQIITNLVCNSVEHGFHDFTPDNPKIHLTIRLIEKNSEKILQIEYSDNGKGMTAEQKEKVFEPFYTTRRAEGGSGLGLSIVYNLITQLLGGKISCISEPDKGSVFLMTLADHESTERQE